MPQALRVEPSAAAHTGTRWASFDATISLDRIIGLPFRPDYSPQAIGLIQPYLNLGIIVIELMREA